MLPNHCWPGIRKDDRLSGNAAKLLRHPLRKTVLRRNYGNQPLNLEPRPCPLPHCTRRLGRVAASPMSTRKRPAQLRLTMLAGLRNRLDPPITGIPHHQANPAEHDSIRSPLDGELPEAVGVPAIEPTADDKRRIGGSVRVHPTEEAHRLRIGIESEQRPRVLQPRQPQQEPFRRDLSHNYSVIKRAGFELLAAKD